MSDSTVSLFALLQSPSSTTAAGAGVSAGLPTRPGASQTARSLAGRIARDHLPRAALVGAGLAESSAKIHGATQTRASASVMAGRSVRFTGQAMQATMPPPKAPRVQFGAATRQAFASLANESRTVFQNNAAWVGSQPILQQAPGATLISPTAGSIDAVANQAGSWTANAGMSVKAFANGGLLAFMKLRVEANDGSINALQNIANATDNLQSTTALEQADAATAMDAEIKKAQKKAGILGLFNKIFEVVMAVVITAITVASLDPEVAAAAIALSAVIGLIAGAIAGKGKGFNIGTALDAYSGALSLADPETFILNAIFKVVTKVVEKVAFKAILDAATDGLDTAATPLADEATDRLNQTLEELQSKIGDPGADADDIADAGGAAGAGSAADAVEEGAADAASTQSSTITAEQIEQEQERALRKGTKELFTDVRDGVSKALTTLLKKGAINQDTIEEMGTRMSTMGMAAGVAQIGDQVGSSIVQLQVSNYQADGDADMATFKQLQAMVKLLDETYKTATDLVQTLTKSHSNAVDAVQSILKNNNDVQNLIAGNMAQI